MKIFIPKASSLLSLLESETIFHKYATKSPRSNFEVRKNYKKRTITSSFSSFRVRFCFFVVLWFGFVLLSLDLILCYWVWILVYVTGFGSVFYVVVVGICLSFVTLFSWFCDFGSDLLLCVLEAHVTFILFLSFFFWVLVCLILESHKTLRIRV